MIIITKLKVVMIMMIIQLINHKHCTSSNNSGADHQRRPESVPVLRARMTLLARGARRIYSMSKLYNCVDQNLLTLHAYIIYIYIYIHT